MAGEVRQAGDLAELPGRLFRLRNRSVKSAINKQEVHEAYLAKATVA